ncbi:hypothetical protein QE422_003326 [Chryseobacterium sp. SORGH_AS 447]|uniref:hypothetical protein n=1 Tax=Chryseobacterium sp. SORGH_AS_0447 TaxID=3041769 RepID=UPI002786E7F5|nr:hypothetical protein [Chryseobacterium sp. SORGH_AS_0447]MDQ1162958.1 hypothetical protein [Chryseobacterium sp. SORGH_AS_0447]
MEIKDTSDYLLPPFFESLHRPFHQPLKSTRWVCEFMNSSKKVLRASEVNIEFYLFLVNKLHSEYNRNTNFELSGLSSRSAIFAVFNYLHEQKSKQEKINLIIDTLRCNNRNDVQKQIYSSYKAASYYVNLAKEKLNLVNSTSKLTQYGKELVLIRTQRHSTNLTKAEKVLYFKLLVKNDFLLFISLCLFKKLEFKFNVENIENLYFDFIDHFYGIKHFNYNRRSLSNYNIVREAWISQIQILTKTNQIKSEFVKILKSDPVTSKWFNDLHLNFTTYINENFKNDRSFESKKLDFIRFYEKCIDEKKDVKGFVNLYDIKENIRISYVKFNEFVSKFYEDEKSKRHIFFSNIVSSIDGRKRFIVRGRPVLKIKFKHEIK